MSWRDAPLYIEAHDLARWLLERSDGQPAEAVVSRRLALTGCQLVEAVSLALTFPLQRAHWLQEADGAVVRIRVLLRLGRDLGGVSAGGVRFATGRLRTIGRMIGGWRKRVSRSSLPDAVSLQGAGHPAPGA